MLLSQFAFVVRCCLHQCCLCVGKEFASGLCSIGSFMSVLDLSSGRIEMWDRGGESGVLLQEFGDVLVFESLYVLLAAF